MRKYKYLHLIIYLNITMMAITNILSGKLIGIGFLSLSAASLCIPIVYVIGDTLTEVYGYKVSRRANWVIIISSIVTAIFMQLAVLLPPAEGFTNNDAYVTVLSIVPRIVLAAWVALFCGQFLNDYVLAKMKIWTKGKHLWARTIGSTIVGQAVDSTTFYVIALAGIIPNSLLFKAILSAWFVKVLIEIAITPITYRVVKKLKKAEGVDHYDRKTNFSPFAVKQI